MEEQIIAYFDLFGTVIFAITGALRGIKKELDFLGVVVLACTVGVGGGIMRDVIIGATPVAALSNDRYLVCCIITGSVTFFAFRLISRANELIIILDAIGLGVFTSLGAAKALSYNLPNVGVVLAGVITAVGGGVIRDMMVAQIPAVLKSDFYATASLLGGILFIALRYWPLPYFTDFVVVSLFVTLLRLWAVHYEVELPRAAAQK